MALLEGWATLTRHCKYVCMSMVYYVLCIYVCPDMFYMWLYFYIYVFTNLRTYVLAYSVHVWVYPNVCLTSVVMSTYVVLLLVHTCSLFDDSAGCCVHVLMLLLGQCVGGCLAS